MSKPHTALGIGVESPERVPKVFGRARTWNGKPDPPDSYREGNAIIINAGIQNAGMRECGNAEKQAIDHLRET